MRISDWSSRVLFRSQHRDSFRASLLIEPTETLSNYTVFDYAKVNEAPGALITSDVAATAGCFPGLGCPYGTLPAELGAIQDDLGLRRRSEERRVGDGCVRQGRTGWSPDV